MDKIDNLVGYYFCGSSFRRIIKDNCLNSFVAYDKCIFPRSSPSIVVCNFYTQSSKTIKNN